MPGSSALAGVAAPLRHPSIDPSIRSGRRRLPSGSATVAPMAGDLGRPLLDREAEVERIETTLDAAAMGAGALLAIAGEAGAGKTTLLDGARARGRDRGLMVLSARATELEREYAFGVVRQWLDPVLRSLDTAERAALLEGNAANALPVLDSSAPPGGSTFATLDGLHWILAALAESGPLVAVVDDAQWADPDSRRFLAFLATRVGELPIALLVASRTGEGDDDELATALRTGAPMVVGPLSEAAVRTLVEEHLGEAGVDTFTIACHRTTGGNPFLLHALLDELHRTGVTPTPAAAERVLALGPRAVATAVVARLAMLAPSTPAVARALSVLGDGATRAELAALVDQEEGMLAVALDELERAAIITADDDPVFVHAITRNAIRADMGRSARSQLHQRAAHVLAERHAPAERLAAHLLAAGAPLDDAGIGIVRQAAGAAQQRGAVDTAVGILRQVLPDCADHQVRVDVLRDLAQAEALTDGPAAVEHLREALTLATDPSARSAINAALGRGFLIADRPVEAVAAAGAALREAGDLGDPDLVHRLEALQFAPARVEPSLRDVRFELRTRFQEHGLRSDGVGARGLQGGMAMHESRALTIDARTAVEQATWALAEGILLEQDNGSPDFIGAVLALAAADAPHAREVLQAGLVQAARRGDVFAHAAGSIFLCQDHLQRGELADAISAGEEGLAASDAYGIAFGALWGTGYLGQAYLAAGDIDAAAKTLARAHPSGDVPDSAHWHPHLHARTELLLARGEHDAAVAAALDLGTRFEGVEGRNPAVAPWRSLAARGLLALGTDAERATALAAEEVDLARQWGAPRGLGRALRVLGLVVGAEEGLAHLEESEVVLRDSPNRLEHAESLVAVGAALRRANQRSAARPPLTQGLALARKCGGVPLAERAAEELAAAGGRPGKAPTSGLDALTPSERRVARLAADGMTNRQIAQHLFVTQKTVEFHLGQAFRKLAIPNRGELATCFDQG